MHKQKSCPLFDHVLDEPSAFTPEDLVQSVRTSRGLPDVDVPSLCVLDFDGDLTDWLVRQGQAVPFTPWACFHTTLYVLETEGIRCGIVARTIGGPYAVLIAEQLHVSGAQLILGLTSAGRIAPTLPLPSFVVATRAVRDEGTSLHYLPAAETIECPTPVVSHIHAELSKLGTTVLGTVWTTDAPYRETEEQIQRHADAGVLAVEMQASALFAFATARKVNLGVVAHLTNAIGHSGEQFEKGTEEDGFAILRALLRAGKNYLEERTVTACEPSRALEHPLSIQTR
jgi:uridine phosphorylase